MERAATRRSSLSLSDLPKTVIQEILCRLPIIEAGRTSILSRSWRYRWRSIPDLRISGLYPPQIYQLLLLHSGSVRLLKLEEHERGSLHYNEWDDSDLVRWIHALSQHSASTLDTLCLDFYNSYCYIDNIASGFPNLTHLHFTGSLTVLPGFPGFPSLKSMFLCVYESDDDFSEVISCCPLLEDLHVTFPSKDARDSTTLDIVGPSLRRLRLSEIVVNNLSVKSAPFLETVSIRSCYYDVEDEEEADENSVCDAKNEILMKFFRGMASIRELELHKEFILFLGSGHVAERIPITFGNLKAVYLNADFCVAETVLGILCLLGSTPVLEVLGLRVCNCLEPLNEVLDDGHGFWEAQEHLFNKLKTVVITNIACRKNEMGFVKFLLAKAEFLKNIVISFHHLVKNKDSFMAELCEFPRLSHQARILFTRYPISEEEDFPEGDFCC